MHPSPGKNTMMDALPSLPLELQISILSYIPPQSLYTLRRTCPAWNSMLSNPNLLNHIHNNLPYLTSASSLTSRLKRRQRMRYNNPVWAKPLNNAFPWASDLQRVGGPPCIRFWNGWMVVLTPNPSMILPQFREQAKIILKIGHITWPLKKTISIDVVHALGLRNDRVGLHDAPGEDTNVGKVMTNVLPFHLHVQEGRILVGLKKMKFIPPLHPLQFKAPKATPIYFAIFDLNGTLLSPIVITPPVGQSKHDVVVLTRLNTIHLLTLCQIDTVDPTLPRASLSPSLPCIYRLNIYSLSSRSEVAPEVTIRAFPRQDHADLNLGHAHGMAHINARMGFDDLDMVWFPRLPGFDLEFSCLEQRAVAGGEQSPCVRKFWERDLPHSLCGGWVIFSGTEGLPKVRTSLRHGDGSQLRLGRDHEIETLYEEQTPAGPDSGSVSYINEYKNVQLVTLGHSVAIGEEHNEVPHNVGLAEGTGTCAPPTGTLLKLRKCKSHHAAQTTTRHTIHLPHDLPSTQQTWMLSNMYWNENGEFQSVTGASKCPFWGYVVRNTYKAPPGKAFENLYLLPYTDDGEWEVVQNGLPSDFFHTFSIVPGEDLDVVKSEIVVSMRSGDDGLVCWSVVRVTGHTTIMGAWVVCYEEEWGLDEEGASRAE